jgi:hypothetical protein
MSEFVIKKYGTAFFTFKDEEYTIGCFSYNGKVVIRKKQNSSSSQIEKKDIMRILNNLLSEDSIASLLTINFEDLSKYLGIHSDGNDLQGLITEIEALEIDDIDFSKEGFYPHFLLLKLLEKKESVHVLQETIKTYDLYFRFLKQVGAIPESSGIKKEYRDVSYSNPDYYANELIKEILISDKYILYIHQGSFSKFDMVLKYKVLKDGVWSRIRTPKHIHWAVDLVLKKQIKKELSIHFIEKLLDYWNSIESPMKTNDDRNRIIQECISTSLGEEYKELDSIGEYPIEFLWLMALLLIQQEKANNFNAFMFKDLLTSLKENDEIYKIISIATHR